MGRVYQRDYDDYLLDIGDRCRMKMDDGSPAITGKVVGRGAAGNYIKLRGDDGGIYEGYSCDCTKIFPEDEQNGDDEY